MAQRAPQHQPQRRCNDSVAKLPTYGAAPHSDVTHDPSNQATRFFITLGSRRPCAMRATAAFARADAAHMSLSNYIPVTVISSLTALPNSFYQGGNFNVIPVCERGSKKKGGESQGETGEGPP